MLASVVAALLALAAGAPSVHVVKTTLGSRGAVQGGRYVVEDPRTSFQAGRDRTVIASFEWSASPGGHHCEASWRDPSGKIVLVQPVDQQARGTQFGVYWTLSLPDQPALGLWAVETTVDGQPGGTQTFQVTSDPAPARPPAVQALSPAELYARAGAATVTVEALGPVGERLWAGAGFHVDARRVVTAFRVIEGASTLRLLRADGAPAGEALVLLGNRRQDWAILQSPVASAAYLVLSRQPAAVGDRGQFLDASQDGSRILQEAEVAGRREHADAGARLVLSTPVSGAAVGGPLLDDAGAVTAIVGTDLVPGTGVGSIRGFGLTTLALPVEALPDLATVPAEGFKAGVLLDRGLAAVPIPPATVVQVGIIGHSNGAFASMVSADTFSRRQEEPTARITWDADAKKEGPAVFRIFDVDNKALVASTPTKVKLRGGGVLVTTWKVPVSQLPPGTYRVDLYFSDAAVWRSFFTVTD